MLLVLVLLLTLPAAALALAFRARPHGREYGDPFGATLAARGLFRQKALAQDPDPVVPESTEPIRFRLHDAPDDRS